MAFLRIHTFDQIWRMPQDTDWTWTGQTESSLASWCNWDQLLCPFQGWELGIWVYGIYIYIELYIYVVDVGNTCVTVHI